MPLVNLATGQPAGVGYAAPAPNLVGQAGGVLAGIPRAQLLANLAAAQAAYAQLMAGGKVVSASYAQGDGSKSVTYTAADQGALVAYIAQLQQQLGIVRHARRPMRPFFG